MHARRTAYLLTAALLTAGCVAVPHGPAPEPTDRPAALAPAAERAPAPLPTWPEPVQPAPREALAATEPRTVPAPAPASSRPTAERRGTAAAPPPEKTRKETGRKREPKKKEPTEKDRTRAVPRPPKKDRPLRPRGRPSAAPAAGQPELRRLCRQAERIDAPMGAAGLCRSVYGP
ncbi:hypothetical protein [Streptomyces bikiniensis]|uniref:hypothetical protein n=1 Tax=Streptomyces bikiniensis TaxID=1896 RepID=UPI0004C1E851|nr:hypothetical protein [Streptomyces bikiniensis]